MESAVKAEKRKLFYGWWIVIACSSINLFSSGTFYYGFTAFFEPMVREFGWSRAATSLAFSLQRLEGGIAAPIVGMLVDRFGPRKLILLGFSVVGAGFVLMSQIDSLTMFYVTFLLISTGASMGGGGVGMVAVANWFSRNRGKALGLMMSGVGLSGALVPALVWIISSFGWRTALLIVGVGTWMICLPLAMLVRHRPEQYGMLPDGDDPGTRKGDTTLSSRTAESSPEIAVIYDDANFGIRQALRTRAFWFLALALSVGQIATGAMFVHELPYLLSIGIPAETGALVIMFMTLSSIAGRMGFGWLGDYIDRRYVLAMAYALQAVGLLVAALAQNIWHVALFVVTFGPGYGGPIPVRPALQADYFGRRSFGAIQGLLMGVTTLGGIAGPVFAGYMFDIGGNYRTAFLLIALFLIPAVPSFLLMKKPAPKDRV